MAKRLLVGFIALFSAAGAFGASRKLAMNKEKALWEALKTHDASVFESSLASDYTGVYADGVRNRKEEIAAIPTINLKDYAISNVNIAGPLRDATLVTYKITIEGTRSGRDISGAYYVSSLWVSRGGLWRNVLHAAVRQATERHDAPPAK
jgi:Domain of unknown function (DUF4440)